MESYTKYTPSSKVKAFEFVSMDSTSSQDESMDHQISCEFIPSIEFDMSVEDDSESSLLRQREIIYEKSNGHLYTELLGKRFKESPSDILNLCETRSACSYSLIEFETSSLMSDVPAQLELKDDELKPNSSDRPIINLLIAMCEDNCLKVEKDDMMFEESDKLFISNILYIKNRSKVDHKLDQSAFIQSVNEGLSSHEKEKRRDDRMRFVYKRAIKLMFENRTEYKIHLRKQKMEIFGEEFMRYYFDSDDVENHDVIDTSFASKKKLSKIFKKSPIFKADFESALEEIKQNYSTYRSQTYYNMLAELEEKDHKSPPTLETLQKKFKRLPWTDSDIEKSIQLVSSVMKKL